ncbi:TraR/DksA family transcriptional regulator [Janibacter hoylei PVAS-1]|uniref:DNA-binding protein n=1 Tax=Janibacter hoylei PVAS-1 TaxID=1210046 RepID=K1E9L3_9MICO|nr:TraR/DksA C4-type zinc finger protein [Janibacter hoylei]EKA62137.1 TraR/DksA family transcriptional regulator [Janibacter hoylei PVAS-1]RWU85136.1 DNA-binding protein [Janibacter hoylei PVAS-1]
MATKKTATGAAERVKSAARATVKRVSSKKEPEAKGTTAKKSTAASANGSTTSKGATKKATTKKTNAPKKTSATKAAAKKTAAKKAAATNKAAPKKASTSKSTTKKAAAQKTAAKKAPAKKTAAQLVVREDESPWTAKELKEVRAELDTEIQRLTAEISSAETDLNEFLKEPIDGAGDDQADAGAKSFEREHELSLVAGARTGLEQNLHALARLEDGTYGICENCGNPIGKLRLQAYPRATLCMTCKSRQERR